MKKPLKTPPNPYWYKIFLFPPSYSPLDTLVCIVYNPLI